MAYADDKLIIDTPEQIPLEFHLAGVGSRALALMFDTLILAICYVVGAIILAFILAGSSLVSPGSATWVFAIFILIAFALQWGYFATFETIWKGQTPGKRYMDIRVIKDSGAPITAYEAIGRNLLRVIDSIPLYGIGILTVMLNKQNKRLGDLMAGTVVVHERPLTQMHPVWNPTTSAQAAEQAASALASNVARLSMDELELIEAFLQRRYELAPNVRVQTAFQISERVAHSLQIPREGRPAPETLLETLARERRNHMRYS